MLYTIGKKIKFYKHSKKTILPNNFRKYLHFTYTVCYNTSAFKFLNTILMQKTKMELSGAQSGGIFITNVAALGFFFWATTAISAVFFPLYLGYFINTGLQLYKRKLDIAEDLKNFISSGIKL